MNYIKKGTFLLIAAIGLMNMLSACSTVKSYQKNKINDSEMVLGARTVQKFEQSFELYREGASGANGGKSGGGCGCN
ncbi:MAG: hypothetical protein JWQ25_850 [Daejeonella sp.]|nr:hypothetical protein [Daejeonella sp.]